MEARFSICFQSFRSENWSVSKYLTSAFRRPDRIGREEDPWNAGCRRSGRSILLLNNRLCCHNRIYYSLWIAERMRWMESGKAGCTDLTMFQRSRLGMGKQYLLVAIGNGRRRVVYCDGKSGTLGCAWANETSRKWVASLSFKFWLF